MKRRAKQVTVLLAVAGLALVLSSCGKRNPGSVRGSIPPETSIQMTSSGSEETRTAVHLFWSGTDEDGEVVRFRVRVDSLDWTETSRTDSVLMLREIGDVDSLDPEAEYTFQVKAVDDDGLEDPTPASITFTSRNTAPETEITHGPAAVTSTMVCFDWLGWDYDGVVVGYGYALYHYEYDEWLEVAREDSLPPDEISIMLGPLAGLHRFEVWSIDDLGAIDPTPAQREFTCNPELWGPRLTVVSDMLETFVFRGGQWSPGYDEPICIFEGESLVFDWSAEESGSCPLMGYSYAYDDTTEWCHSFSLEDTHFEVTPTPGEHSLYVAAMGSAGDLTRGRIFVNVIEPSLDDYILVVDDYDHLESMPVWGTDEQRDAFYDSLASGYGHPVVQWDCEEHVLEGMPQPADAQTLAGASTVIWYCDQVDPAIELIYDPYYNRYDWLAGYVRSGGNLILLGFTVLGNITGETYPIAISPHDTGLARAFVRDCLGIGYAKCSGAAANKNSPWSYGYCFHGAVPGATGIPGGRLMDLEPMYIDSVGAGGYPEPGKWFLYTMTDPNYSRCGLPYVEALEPYDGLPIEAYGIDAYLNYNFEGETCCLLSPTGTSRGNICYFGFPLYYLQTDQVRAVFDRLLPLFGEERL
jgi:hypothetical protein